MREYHRAKMTHWDPRLIVLDEDKARWASFSPVEQAVTRQFCTLFMVGTQKVVTSMVPLLASLQMQDGNVEDRMFLALQYYEEARMAEFFDRWLLEVVVPNGELDGLSSLSPAYRRLFFERLPATIERYRASPSRNALAVVCVLDYMVLKGGVSQTGIYLFKQAMRWSGILPGLLEAIWHLHLEEERHVTYGLDLIRRLMVGDSSIQEAVNATIEENVSLAVDIITEEFARFGDQMPFGLSLDSTLAFTAKRFAARRATLIPQGRLG